MSDKKIKKNLLSTPLKGKIAFKSDKIYPNSLWFSLSLIFIVFLPSLSGGFLNWDDPKYIIDNAYIKNFSWAGFKAMFFNYYGGNYHPFTALSNAIEYKMFGLNAKVYHCINLLIHLINALLVFKVIMLLCNEVKVAVLVSLLFGIHPMHVESVAWISERKDVLYTFFYLIAIIKYIRFQEGNGNYKQYFLLILAFFCALLSKSAAVTLPLTLIVIDFYFQKKINFFLIVNKIPLFIFSILFGIIALHSQRVEGSLSDLTSVFFLSDRIFLILYSILFYVVKLFIPIGLSAFHAYPDKVNNLLPWYFYFSPLMFGLIFYMVFKLKEFKKILIFGFLFYFFNIILVIQLIPVGLAIVAERYTYVSYIGLFFIIAKVFFYLEDKFINMKTIIRIAGIAILFIFCIITYNRNKVWNNSISLWNDVIEKNSNISLAYYNLGNAHKNIMDYQGAVAAYTGAIRTKAGHENALFNRAHAYADMAMHKEAINDYSTLIQLLPLHEESFLNRAISNASLNNYDAAIADYSSAIKINPQRANTFYSRGNMKASLKFFDVAISDYNVAIELNPQLSEAYNNRGNCKLNLNNITAACEDWGIARELGNTQSLNMLQQYCK